MKQKDIYALLFAVGYAKEYWGEEKFQQEIWKVASKIGALPSRLEEHFMVCWNKIDTRNVGGVFDEYQKLATYLHQTYCRDSHDPQA